MAQRSKKVKVPSKKTNAPSGKTKPKPSTRTGRSARGEGEAAGRRRGYEASGGKPGDDLLEDGQLRGVDEEGRVTTGTHGGPKKKEQRKNTGREPRAETGSRSSQRNSRRQSQRA